MARHDGKNAEVDNSAVAGVGSTPTHVVLDLTARVRAAVRSPER